MREKDNTIRTGQGRAEQDRTRHDKLTVRTRSDRAGQENIRQDKGQKEQDPIWKR